MQSIKAHWSIFFTLPGMYRLVMLMSWKASWPMVSSPSGRVREVMSPQSWKAPSPISRRLLGRSRLVRGLSSKA